MSGRTPINSALLVKVRPLLILRASTSDVALDSDAARVAKLVQEKQQDGSLAAYIKQAMLRQMLHDEQSFAARSSGLHVGVVPLTPYQTPVAQPVLAQQTAAHKSVSIEGDESGAVVQPPVGSTVQGAGTPPSVPVSHLDIIEQTVERYESNFVASPEPIPGEREARPRRRPGGGALSAMG